VAEEVQRHIVNGEGTSELFKNVFETEQRLVTPAFGRYLQFQRRQEGSSDGVNWKNAILVVWPELSSTKQQATPSSLFGGLMPVQRR